MDKVEGASCPAFFYSEKEMGSHRLRKLCIAMLAVGLPTLTGITIAGVVSPLIGTGSILLLVITVIVLLALAHYKRRVLPPPPAQPLPTPTPVASPTPVIPEPVELPAPATPPIAVDPPFERWLDLPAELLQHILNACATYTTLGRMAQVCRTWRAAEQAYRDWEARAENPAWAWMQLPEHSPTFRPQGLERLLAARRCTFLRDLYRDCQDPIVADKPLLSELVSRIERCAEQFVLESDVTKYTSMAQEMYDWHPELHPFLYRALKKRGCPLKEAQLESKAKISYELYFFYRNLTLRKYLGVCPRGAHGALVPTLKQAITTGGSNHFLEILAVMQAETPELFIEIWKSVFSIFFHLSDTALNRSLFGSFLKHLLFATPSQELGTLVRNIRLSNPPLSWSSWLGQQLLKAGVLADPFEWLPTLSFLSDCMESDLLDLNAVYAGGNTPLHRIMALDWHDWELNRQSELYWFLLHPSFANLFFQKNHERELPLDSLLKRVRQKYEGTPRCSRETFARNLTGFLDQLVNTYPELHGSAKDQKFLYALALSANSPWKADFNVKRYAAPDYQGWTVAHTLCEHRYHGTGNTLHALKILTQLQQYGSSIDQINDAQMSPLFLLLDAVVNESDSYEIFPTLLAQWLIEHGAVPPDRTTHPVRHATLERLRKNFRKYLKEATKEVPEIATYFPTSAKLRLS